MAAAVLANADELTVHDLRTGIRRLSECLRAFDALFPQGEAARVRRRLRKVMVLAAEVRNRDIAGNLFVKAGISAEDPMLDRLRREKQEWQTVLLAKLVVYGREERPKRWLRRLKAQ